MIDIRHLKKKYENDNRYVINDLSISLPDTGIITIVGKSGAGKSTFIRLIGTIDLDYMGSIKINGKEVKEMPQKELSDFRFQNIGFSFQKEEFDESMTVSENMLWQLKITDLNRTSKQEAILAALNLVQLVDKKDDLIKNLSGGERKRVGIARAILSNPRILILDEPFASLDEKNKEKVIDTLNLISKYALVIIVTHSKIRLREDTLIECVDGNFRIIDDNRNFNNKSFVKEKKRRKYMFIDAFKNFFRVFKENRLRYILVLLGLILGNTCFGLSFYLTSNVKETVSETLKGTIDQNSLKIIKENQKILDDSLYGATINISQNVFNDFSSYVSGYGMYFYGNFEQLFDAKNNCFITLNNNNKININSLSVRSFINPVRDYEENIKILNLKNDEIVLMLKEQDYISLENMLGIYSIEKYIDKYGLYLNLDISASVMQYSAECIFKIIKVLKGKSSGVIVNSHNWNIDFVTKELKLEPYYNLEIENEIPWKIKCSSFITVYEDLFLDFYKEFVTNKKYDSLLLEKIEIETNRYSIIVDNISDTKIVDVYNIYNIFKNNINSMIISNSSFGFLADGRYCGFSKPLFFSNDRSKLNKLADANYQSKANLEIFQGATFDIEDGIYKCDLISSVKSKDCIKYKVYTNKHNIIYGKEPSNINEILISSSLAIQCFNSIEESIDNILNCVALTETVQTSNTYINKFKDIDFKITGIIEDEDLSIYQSAYFPTAFLISKCDIKANDSRCNGALINFDNSITHEDILNFMLNQYDEYICTFPGEILEDGINESIMFVNIFLISFSIFIMIISLSMLNFVLNILISKEKRKIGIFLTYGFYKKEIFKTYFVSILSLITYSTLSSIVNIIIISIYENIIYEGNSIMLGNINPIVFFSMIMFSLFSLIIGSIYVYFKINKYSPFECFQI